MYDDTEDKYIKTGSHMTMRSWEVEVEAGRIPVVEALYQWTTMTAKGTAYAYMKPLCKLVRKWLPKAEWPPEGQHFLVYRVNPVYWHGPADFYAFANQTLGGLGELFDFLKDYVEEKDPERAKDMLSAKQQELATRKAESERLVLDEGKTQQEAAEVLGVDRSTVSRDMCRNSDRAEKVHNPRSRARIELNAGTAPTTAAQRIREKFGDEYAAALREALN